MKHWSLLFYGISLTALVIVGAVRKSTFDSLSDFAHRADHTRELVTTLQQISLGLKSAQIYSPNYEKADTIYYRFYKKKALEINSYLHRLDSLAGNDLSLRRYTDSISQFVKEEFPTLLENNVVEIIQQHQSYRLRKLFNIESMIDHIVETRTRDLAGIRKHVDAQMIIMKRMTMILLGLALAALLVGIRTNLALYRRQRRLIRELQEHQQQLDATNKRLEKYVYAASHDFQEPLRKIMLFADLLKNDTDATARQQKISRITAAAQRMSQLIKDTLRLSAMQRNEAFATVNLNEVINEVIDDLELAISDRSASITHDLLPAVFGSQVQLRQLFINLLSNALKFSHPDRQCVITIGSEPFNNEPVGSWQPDSRVNYCHIVVQDNGIGLPAGDPDSIFDMFVKVHANSHYSGSGIGLALCRQVAVNHGGQIWAERIAMAGSRFHIVLPLAGK